MNNRVILTEDSSSGFLLWKQIGRVYFPDIEIKSLLTNKGVRSLIMWAKNPSEKLLLSTNEGKMVLDASMLDDTKFMLFLIFLVIAGMKILTYFVMVLGGCR